ncbi:MAG: hypothetical protein M5R41_01940 [Bacteroidia bacterium]|nr:hypothetical protein [Bacteroidia bacterium]
MAQPISHEAARRAAALAKLIIADGELSQTRADMEDMRQAIEALRSVPLTGGDTAVAHAPGSPAMREDEPRPTRVADLEDILQRAAHVPAPRWIHVAGEKHESRHNPLQQTDDTLQHDGTNP